MALDTGPGPAHFCITNFLVSVRHRDYRVPGGANQKSGLKPIIHLKPETMKCLLQRIIPSCCIVICAMVLQAQNLDYFRQFKSEGGNFALRKTLRDAAGNYYLCGSVHDSTDISLGGTPYYIAPPTVNVTAGFVAKYTPNMQLLWAYTMGGNSP